VRVCHGRRLRQNLDGMNNIQAVEGEAQSRRYQLVDLRRREVGIFLGWDSYVLTAPCHHKYQRQLLRL
jgi:hypothetical protein